MADAPAVPEPTRLLVVTAHPDDVDFGAGGTVASLTDRGVDVVYCIVTDGDAGGFDPSVPRGDIAGIRRAEQTAAAKELGVDELHFLGYPDGRVVASLELRRDLSRVIRTVRPDAVMCQSPERNWTSVFASHPDHRAAGTAALDAVYPDARNPFTFTELVEHEGLEAHSVGQVWVMAGPTPNRWIDTTEQFDRKIAALLRHESQIRTVDGFSARIRTWNEANAAAGGLPVGRTAEMFQILDTR
jgi:LmbE family N-acetylglucosaminyl deacetylase